MTKYRAVIDGKAYYFTLQEMAQVALMNDEHKYIDVFDFWNALGPVIRWLAAGNEPDRFTDKADINGKDIYENDRVLATLSFSTADKYTMHTKRDFESTVYWAACGFHVEHPDIRAGIPLGDIYSLKLLEVQE